VDEGDERLILNNAIGAVVAGDPLDDAPTESFTRITPYKLGHHLDRGWRGSHRFTVPDMTPEVGCGSFIGCAVKLISRSHGYNKYNIISENKRQLT